MGPSSNSPEQDLQDTGLTDDCRTGFESGRPKLNLAFSSTIGVECRGRQVGHPGSQLREATAGWSFPTSPRLCEVLQARQRVRANKDTQARRRVFSLRGHPCTPAGSKTRLRAWSAIALLNAAFAGFWAIRAAGTALHRDGGIDRISPSIHEVNAIAGRPSPRWHGSCVIDRFSPISPPSRLTNSLGYSTKHDPWVGS